MEVLTSTFLVFSAYLWGGIPLSYIVARRRKGIDIRKYGSGNVGAANIMAHVGKKIGFLVGLFDCIAKGAIPIVVAKYLGVGDSGQVFVGLMSITGHVWSPYIRFTGGRGVATSAGVVCGLFMWQEALIIFVLMGIIGGLILRETGLWTFISILILPIITFVFQRPPEIQMATLGIGAILIAKRLTANWEHPKIEGSLLKVFAYRALWDRDVLRKKHWTDRQPDID